jgi:hypothetical protein
MYNIERGALIMAKKNYTPEEMQAKMAKKSDNCKVFFGTFTKALAVFLAVVIAWSLVAIAYTAPSMGGTVVAGTATNNGGSTSTDDNTGSVDAPSTDDESLLGGEESTDAPADDEATDAPADENADAPADENADAPANDSAAPATKADVIKFFNAETAKAAKGSYKLSRSGKFIKNIDVGSATGALNSIIQGVDENASLDSVVGGFLGIKANPITGEVKNGKGEGFDAKYMIKAMTLTDADVKDFAVNGNKYSIQINACTNPGANSAMAHATNDYVTFAEVNKSIANEVGNAVQVVEGESQANYSKIIFTATVVDGKITALDYSYTFGATLKIKLAIMNATGTGEAEITGKYTNVKY